MNNNPGVNLPVSIRKLSSNKFIEEICQGQFEDQGNILFEDSFINKINGGNVVGVITRVSPNDIVVDIGLKSIWKNSDKRAWL